MSESQQPLSAYAGRRVLVTGGLGFIGSTLAIRLAGLGAEVTCLDSMLPEYGGNTFNIAPAAERVRVNYCDIRDENSVNWIIRDVDFVFHLAGQSDHVRSLTNPIPDIEMNIKGTAIVLEACRRHAPSAVLVYSGTRGQYGRSVRLPVAEDAPSNPLGIYEVSRLAAEKMIQVYNDANGVRSVMLRLTNVYGPRSQMRHNRFGVANWFVRQALDGETIRVFGDGSLLRDFLYVDDCVDAMLRAAVTPAAYGEVFNVGHDQPVTFLAMVQAVIAAAGGGNWEFAPFTPERAAQNPGSYYTDTSKIGRIVGWRPTTTLADGLARTVEYYRLYRRYYW